MSTSPSWFDQEKFSRLVKKVGPKSAPEPVSAQPAPQPGSSPEGVASTARISLVSRPPSLLTEHRALPALPRRTTPLPALKALFEYPAKTSSPADQPPGEEPATEPAPQSEEVKPDEITSEQPPTESSSSPAAEIQPPTEEHKVDDVEGIWQKMALLNEELAQTIQERDQALHDANILRDQLQASDETLEGNRDEATKEEFARLIRERDEALAETQALRAQIQQQSSPPTFGKPPEGLSKTKELSMLATERDQARKEYAELRKQFESLKQAAPASAAPPKEESMKFRKELEQQLEGFRQKLEERNREIAALKAGGATPGAAPTEGGGDEKLKEEIASLREQLAKAKEEASVAQRGLALSQKALHETRDTLREATEGTSLSRHNFDNLKGECAALSQQNTVLQAQNEQLTRELAAAKSKLTSRS